MRFKLPRFMVAAPKSGSGKTLLTCALMRVFRETRQISAYKCGPDFVDPMFHEKVLGTPCKNLDTFFTGEGLTKFLMSKDAPMSDLGIMEGVMGYYDGMAGTSTEASSYDLARVTQTPVLLIVDGRGRSVSVAAEIKGFLSYREPSYIEGIIFNHVSENMYLRLKNLVEEELGVNVYGYLPEIPDVSIKSRHLGLLMPDEIPDLTAQIDKVAGAIRTTVDFQGILSMAAEAPALSCRSALSYFLFTTGKVKLAVAKDEAFSFYYKDNLELLSDLGAEITYFSLLHDEKLPDDVSGLLIGGGYPELFAEQLSQNETMKKSVYEALSRGMPCMAEGGGFLYLGERMTDGENKASYPMVGFLPGESRMEKRLQKFGYIKITETPGHEKHFCGGRPLVIKGHEFHYMQATEEGRDLIAKKPLQEKSWSTGYVSETLYAGLPHLYLYASLPAAKQFIKACRKFASENPKEDAPCDEDL